MTSPVDVSQRDESNHSNGGGINESQDAPRERLISHTEIEEEHTATEGSEVFLAADPI